MSGSPRGILDGLRVVEMSAFVAAPLGGATLAGMGADVVRIDPPGGGIDFHRWPLHKGASLYWAGLNQGKRSVTIDTTGAAGQALAVDLIAHAGVLLTNLPVRGWLSYEQLSQRRDDLIMAVITGNPDGSTAVDYTVNAAMGFPWITGPEGTAGPVNHVLPAWDLLTGSLAATAIIAAELHRVRSGEGQIITLSLADVALSAASHLGLIAEAQLNDEPRGRFGNDLFGSFAHDFETLDGRHVIVVALTSRQWASLLKATHLDDQIAELSGRLGLDFRDEGARFTARGELCALIAPWIARRPLTEIARTFTEHNVLWGPYQTFKQLIAEDDRCSTRNPLFSEVDQPGIGRSLRARSPLVFGRAERGRAVAAPTMGANTGEVLRSWLGFGADAIDALAAQRVVSLGDGMP